MSSVYTLLQGTEPGLDGFDYHRIDAGGVVSTAVAAIPLTTLDGPRGTSGLTLPAGAIFLAAMIHFEDALTHGAATGVLKLAAAANADATSAAVAAAVTAAAASNALAAQTGVSAVALGAPVVLGSATTLQLLAATAANGTGAASTIASASGAAVPVVVSVFYATKRSDLTVESSGFYEVKSLAEQVTQVIQDA